MRFGVLGPLEVRTDAGEPVPVPGGKIRALLADLLVHAGRPVSADRLVEDLWGPAPPRDPLAALQVKVSQLRRVLDAEPGGRDLVASGPAGYRLDAADVDAARFEALAAAARRAAAADRAALLREALELWRGPALADLADEGFARPAARRLEEQRLTALEELAETRLELGEHAELAEELADVITAHPLRERLRAARMRALYRSGRQSEALAVFTDLRTRLREELGVDPGPEIAELHRSILRHDPALAAAPAASRTNLPEAITGLVGRDEALTELRGLLDAHRLVTLTGPGGVGKTRLAVEAARRAAHPGAHPDGVWMVELAAVERGAAVATVADAVQAVLDIRDDGRSGAPPADRLAAALRDRRPLLLLDNCEHVVEAVAELVERLLRAVPGLRVLATSQEPLGVPGETVHAVPPLDAPRSRADSGPDTLRRYSAVRLFAERAAAVAPGFELTCDNAGAVASICRRLDGIPLALELAATRVRALGVHELAARLDDRFRVLATGHRGAPTRQRTLRAMIDWSWELLTGPERAVLRRLAVHADGCGLAAAEEICAGGEVRPGDVLDLLAHLVDRSMVVMTEETVGPRYRLLESVGLYGLDRLAEAGEADRTRDARNAYYARLAESARLHGPDQRHWLAVLDLEHANLRAAVEDAARRGRADVALRLVNALGWYWFLRGRLGEAGRLFRLALAADGGDPAPRARAHAWATAIALRGPHDADRTAVLKAGLEPFDHVADPVGRARAEWLFGEILLGGGDNQVGEELTRRALAVFRDTGDRWGTAAALGTLAHYALVRGDLVTLDRHGREGAALFDDLGDHWGRLRVANLLGRLAEINGDYAEAARLRHDGLRLAEELGMWTQVCDLASGLGRLALLTGDLAGGRRLHERARDLARAQGNRSGEMFAEVGLALGARREGRLDDAERHLTLVLAWNREVGYAPGTAHSLAELGFVAEQRGDAATARARFTESLEIARRTGDARAAAFAQEGLAGVAVLEGDPAEAARLLAAAEAARVSVGAPLPPAERGDVDRIRAAIRSAQSAIEAQTASN
ncbi:AfsR/SARP family transcriptional regulator [Actinomadura kijaniata]|uniref:AfsR/SARP family transcriptional regulator n=1 Tax=Actinomadura kijaniata TaxID=46161 RepID=UPI003F1DE5EE